MPKLPKFTRVLTIQLLTILFAFSAGVCEGEVQSSLEGKQLSVRVYNQPDARGRDYKKATATIRDGAIEFNCPDANEATTFVIATILQPKGQISHKIDKILNP